jgi:hypothetical protein
MYDGGKLFVRFEVATGGFSSLRDSPLFIIF